MGNSTTVKTLKIQALAKTQTPIHLVELYDYDSIEGSTENCTKETQVNALQIELETGAHLKHSRIHIGSQSSSGKQHIEINQAKNSRYQGLVVFAKCPAVESEFKVNLLEEKASCEFKSLFMSTAQNKINLDFTVEHCAAFTQSHVFVRGVADDESKAAFKGKIIVKNEARHSKASLENKNILLSKLAFIQTDPLLEIHCKEVDCKHGATVGALNKDALFYLQSRGLALEAARKLMIQAFLEPVLNQIASTQLRQYIEERL